MQHNYSSENRESLNQYKSIINIREADKSKITIYNITYCRKSVQKLEEMKIQFDKYRELYLQGKSFPEVTFIIPIDHFESENDEPD